MKYFKIIEQTHPSHQRGFFTEAENVWTLFDEGNNLCVLNEEKIEAVMPLWTIPSFKVLLENGAKLKAKNIYRDPPYSKLYSFEKNKNLIYSAAKRGFLDVITYLVEQGGDVSSDNESAISVASARGHLDVVKYLVEHGASIHTRDDEPLVYACAGSHYELVKYLVGIGAKIYPLALEEASKAGDVSIVEYLLENGADARASSYAVFNAIKYKHLPILKILLDRGAPFKIQPYYEYIHSRPFPASILTYAVQTEYIPAIQYLIETYDYTKRQCEDILLELIKRNIISSSTVCFLINAKHIDISDAIERRLPLWYQYDFSQYIVANAHLFKELS